MVFSGTTIEFFVDGVSLGSLSSNVPTGSSTSLDYHYSLNNPTGGVNDLNIFIDYYAHSYTTNR